ncbi:MAG: OmpH family outer membrane protein [Spirochaetia bacterium]
MRKFGLIIGILLLFCNFSFGDQITKVAVVDMSQIYSIYFRESQEVRELEEMRQEFQNELESIQEEIQTLEAERLEAESEGDEMEALELENEIFQKQEYLREFVRIRNAQLERQRQNLTQSTSFLNRIVNAIQYIAEREGYSLVLRSNDENLLWWNRDVDITDQVLSRLLQE